MTSGLEGVRGLVEEIAHQKPEKPDYWNSCSQCERNIDAAQEALAALPTPPAAARGDVRAVLQEMRDRQVARRFKSQTLIDWADRIEAALAAEGVQAGEVEQRARELLAAELGMFPDECSRDVLKSAALRAITCALSQQPEALAKHQPCGCVLCTCEDEKQCQGCGAKYCGNRTDHPAYVKQQPEARGVVDEAMVERFIAATNTEGKWLPPEATDMVRTGLTAALATQHQEPTT